MGFKVADVLGVRGTGQALGCGSICLGGAALDGDASRGDIALRRMEQTDRVPIRRV